MKRSALAKLTFMAFSVSGLLAACQSVPPSPPKPHQAMDHRQPHPEGFWHKFHRPHQLPPEVANACATKNVGDSVTITLQNGKTIQGNCELRFKPDFKNPPPAPPATANS